MVGLCDVFWVMQADTLLISKTNTCTKLIPIMSSRLRPLHLLLVRMLRSCIPTFRFFGNWHKSLVAFQPAIRNTHGTGWRFRDLNAFKKEIQWPLLKFLGEFWSIYSNKTAPIWEKKRKSVSAISIWKRLKNNNRHCKQGELCVIMCCEAAPG